MPLTSSAEKAAEGNHPAPSQLGLLCLLLSPSSQQSGGSSVRTNKQGKPEPKQKRPIGSFGLLARLLPASNCSPSFALCLCVLYPTSRAHRLKNSRLSFYQYPPSPSILSLPWPAKPAPANRLLWQQPAHRADQSESRCRALPASDWSSRVGERSGGSVHARALPCQRPPVYLPSRQTWPSQFG